MLLHLRGQCPVVHEDVGHLQCCYRREHLVVEHASRDVVDDVGSGLDGLAGGERVAGVDGEDGVGVLLADEGDGLDEAPRLFVGGYQLCSGTRGGGSDVDGQVSVHVYLSFRMW